MRSRYRLSDRTVATAKPKPGGGERWISDGGGLWLRIRAGGGRTWYRRHAGDKPVRIGKYPVFGLADARERNETLERAMHGLAPSPTVRAALAEFRADYIDRRYARPLEVAHYLRIIDQALGSRRVIDVNTAEAITIPKLYMKRTGYRSARRLWSVLSTFDDWCVSQGYRALPFMLGRPAMVLGVAPPPRKRVLSDDEIRHLWAMDAPHVDLLRAMLLLGVRISEAQAARWSDLRGDVLHIPKPKRPAKPYDVPLPRLALEIIDRQDKSRETIFAPVSTTRIQQWVKWYCLIYDLLPPWTPHDLRRTTRTLLSRCGVKPHIAEIAINHSLPKLIAIYDQHSYLPELREAFDALGAEVDRILSKSTADAVSAAGSLPA